MLWFHKTMCCINVSFKRGTEKKKFIVKKVFPNKTNTEFQKYLISTTSPPPAFRIREIGSFRDSFI